MTTLTTFPLIVRVLMLTMGLLTRFHLNLRHDSNRTSNSDVFDKENTHKLDVHHGFCVCGITDSSLRIQLLPGRVCMNHRIELG
jgi:hypothetical protein